MVQIDDECPPTCFEGFHRRSEAEPRLAALWVTEHPVDLTGVEQAPPVSASAELRFRRFRQGSVQHCANVHVERLFVHGSRFRHRGFGTGNCHVLRVGSGSGSVLGTGNCMRFRFRSPYAGTGNRAVGKGVEALGDGDSAGGVGTHQAAPRSRLEIGRAHG